MYYQFFLTPAAGKQLIAQAVVQRADVQEALKNHKILVIGGTTNVFVANALLSAIGSDLRTDFASFHRGVAAAPGAVFKKAEFAGDLLIDHGKACFVPDLHQACSELAEGDIIFKGANAVHLSSRTAGILIGNTVNGGTILEASQPVISRRTKLILPVGVEKRVERPVTDLQLLCNAPGSTGLRLFAAPGEPFTEIDAIRVLTGSEAEIISSGAVNGGEGGVYFAACGGDIEALKTLVTHVSGEEKVVV